MERIALLTAAFGAMILTAVSGFFIIPALHKLHFGQTIKEIGPTWHQGKNGTPTMGGLTFYLGCLLGVVLGYAALALSVPEVLGLSLIHIFYRYRDQRLPEHDGILHILKAY